MTLPERLPNWGKALLTDPQTSGGLMVACAPDAESQVLELFRRNDVEQAAVVGRLVNGPAGMRVLG